MFSQQKKPDSKPVKTWFSIIEDKTDFKFVYDNDLPDLDKSIVLKNKIKENEIDSVLQELKVKIGFEYKMLSDNRQIIVIPKRSVKEPVVVKGKVTSNDEPQGLPGINVYVMGTTVGAVTDIYGNYILNVPDKYDILVFSSIEYEKQEIPLNGRTVINVNMKSSSHQLDEIVVTALNIKRDKTSLGYSVTQVSSDEIATVKQNNPINSLTGKVAGLQISSSPSGVDGSSRIVLRGISSLSGNNRPLIVVDGVPVSGDTYGGATKWGGTDKGDALSDINPDDVESISVLKGAGAAALYGSQGANGVILITTKKGKNRKGIGVSFNSNLLISNPMVLPVLQTEYGQGAFGRYPTDKYNGSPVTGGMDAIKNNEPFIWSWGSKMDGSLKEDWLGNAVPYKAQPNFFKEYYQTGITAINTIAFDGGNEKTKFRVSFTQNNSKGMSPNNKMSKQIFNIHGTSKLGKSVDVTAKVNYIHASVKDRPYLAEDPANAGWVMGTLPRNVVLQTLKDNIVDAGGNENWAWDGTSGNPYWFNKYKRNMDSKDRFQALMVINIHIAKRLKLMLRSGLDMTSLNAKEYLAKGAVGISDPLGTYYHNKNSDYSVNSDFLFTYNLPLSSNFSLNFNTGGQHRYSSWNNISQGGSDWKIRDFYHMSNLTSFWTNEHYGQKEALSLYGLADFSFKNFIYLDFTFRNDWSSTLPVDNNAYQFYSVNASFLFTNAFNISSDILSKGKIRGSVARVGNDTGPNQTYNYYSVYQTTYPYPMGGMSGELTFANFKPEITNSWEIGTDLGFLNNRINFDFTYYDGETHNQIMSVELAPSSGFNTQKINAGEVRNYGLEVLLSGKVIDKKDYGYNISLNFSSNKNKVISLSDNAKSRVLLEAVSGFARVELREGEPFGAIYGFDYKRNEKGQKLVDDDGMPMQGNYIKLGDINPDFIGGISNNFTYKNLSVRFLIDFQIGGEYYSESRLYHDLYGTSVKSLEGREEWYSTHTGKLYDQPKPGTFPDGYIEDAIVESTGQINDIPVEPMKRMVNTIWFKKIVSDYILDATNIRFRELSVSYSLPKKWMDNSFFTKINISLVARNLFFFYNASGDYDPESGFNSGSIGNAFELNPMPSPRSYGFNVSFDF